MWPSISQGERPQKTNKQTCQHLDLGLSASKTEKKKFPLFEAQSLYCVVRAARGD